MMDAASKEASLKEASEHIHIPIVMNYLVLPHVPTHRPTLLSPSGAPVELWYNKLDWQKLADNLQRSLTDAGIPKGITVHVCDDAMDLFDISRIDFLAQAQVDPDEYDPITRAATCTAQLQMSDFEASVVPLSKKHPSIHLNTIFNDTSRPPIAGLIISVRYTTAMLAIDWIYTVSELLFGTGDSPVIDEQLNPMGPGQMSAPLASWLRDDTGVVYASQCSIVPLRPTLPKPVLIN